MEMARGFRETPEQRYVPPSLADLRSPLESYSYGDAVEDLEQLYEDLREAGGDTAPVEMALDIFRAMAEVESVIGKLSTSIDKAVALYGKALR